MAPRVGDPVEAGLVSKYFVHESRIVGHGRVGRVLTRIGVCLAVDCCRAATVRSGLFTGRRGSAGATAVEGEVQSEAVLLLPCDDVVHVGGAHLDIGRCVGRVVGHVRGTGEVARVSCSGSALIFGRPDVIGDEDVVDVLSDVVAIEPKVLAAGHPVDQLRAEDQPLQLAGVVVEPDRELGYSRLGVRG